MQYVCVSIVCAICSQQHQSSSTWKITGWSGESMLKDIINIVQTIYPFDISHIIEHWWPIIVYILCNHHSLHSLGCIANTIIILLYNILLNYSPIIIRNGCQLKYLQPAPAGCIAAQYPPKRACKDSTARRTTYFYEMKIEQMF